MTEADSQAILDHLIDIDIRCPWCGGEGGERRLEQDGTENGEKCSACDGFGHVEVITKLDVAAALRAHPQPSIDEHATIERKVIENCVDHWFTQGGESQFGKLGDSHNADELISEILQALRKRGQDK